MMIKWFITGVSTVTIDITIFSTVSTLTKNIILSNLISVSISTVYNYLLHEKWTYKDKKRKIKIETIAKYIIWTILAIIISTTTIMRIVNYGIEESQAKAISIGIIAPIGFIVMKKLIFVKE